MENLGYYNGKYGLIEEMMIPMNDRVCFFGDGVYDATYVRNHKIFALDEHTDRFFNSAALLKIKIPYTKEEIKELLNEMVQKVDSPDQFLYWQITRGTAMRKHEFPDASVKANLWITIEPRHIKDIREPMKLISIEDTRYMHCNIKTLNLLPNVMAAQATKEAGCDECILHRGERVTECAHSNVSILKDGVFVTPPTDHYILPGITRMHLIATCKELNIPVDETTFTLQDLTEADEILISSSSHLCRHAISLDGKPVGGKDPKTLERIQKAYYQKFLDATE